MSQLETANIVLSKLVDSRVYTAWVIAGDGRPRIRGEAHESPAEALEDLLDATAELVAKKLAQRFGASDGNSMGVMDEKEGMPFGRNWPTISLSPPQHEIHLPTPTPTHETAGGASAPQMGTGTGANGLEQSYSSVSGHEYRITDGSSCGYGAEEVLYAAG